MIMARKSRFTDIKVHVHVHIWGLPPQFVQSISFFFFLYPYDFFPCIIKSSIFFLPPSPYSLPTIFLHSSYSVPLVFIILSRLTYSSFSIKKGIFAFIVLELYYFFYYIRFNFFSFDAYLIFEDDMLVVVVVAYFDSS